jgi:hypothetical protein
MKFNIMLEEFIKKHGVRIIKEEASKNNIFY